MKLHMFLVIGCALAVTACADRESAGSAEKGEIKLPAEEMMPMQRAAPKDEVGTEAFVRHMHAHARQLTRLNAALEEGDLAGAMTPAYWLSRHEGISAPVATWQPYMVEMRRAAMEVERAADLETARAAAMRISEGCQGCHSAVGIQVNLTSP